MQTIPWDHSYTIVNFLFKSKIVGEEGGKLQKLDISRTKGEFFRGFSRWSKKNSDTNFKYCFDKCQGYFMRVPVIQIL